MVAKLLPKDYERHLAEELCWACHVPTTKSHARQRQCPECRRKWSYLRLQKEWQLLQLFSTGLNPHKASRTLRISYRTAREYFARFKDSLTKSGSGKAEFACIALSGRISLTTAARKVVVDAVFQELIFPEIKRFLIGPPPKLGHSDAKSTD